MIMGKQLQWKWIGLKENERDRKVPKEREKTRIPSRESRKASQKTRENRKLERVPKASQMATRAKERVVSRTARVAMFVVSKATLLETVGKGFAMFLQVWSQGPHLQIGPP